MMNGTPTIAVFPLTFEQPVWLWLLATIPLLVLFSYRSLAGLERSRRWLALVMRSLVIAAIALALARISYQRENDNLTVIFLLDRSRSIPHRTPNLLAEQEAYVKKVCDQIDKDDKVGVISFSGEANLEQLPMKGQVYIDHVAPASIPDVTNIAHAFRLAMASFPEGTAKRIVLLTDGNENAGDVMREVGIAEANGVSADVVPMMYSHRNEVVFDRMIVPPQAHEGDRIRLRMILRSDHRAKGKIFLTHNDRPLPLGEGEDDLGWPVTLEPGVTPKELKLPLATAGTHRFQARFAPDDESMDQVLQNNEATGFTFVEGTGIVLLLTTNAPDDQPLHDALVREKVDVEMLTVGDVTIDLLELQKYSSIILANVPADAFTQDQHEVLTSYVKDFGGGLIMTGGNEGFGAGGWIGSPVEEVMPVNFEIKQTKKVLRGALVVIMHTCELDRGNYWGEQVAVASLRTISSMDYFGCIAYAWAQNGVNWEVPLAVARNKDSIGRRIKKMQVGDMPDYVSAAKMAVAGLKGLGGKAAQKHIIMISDGDANTQGIQPILRDMVANKITCSTVGIGYGAHVVEPPMRMIAKAAGGTFYPVRNPKRLPQIFVKEAKIVRKPLISEEPFTPQLEYVFSPLITGVADRQAALPQLGGLVLTQRKPSPQVEMPLVRRSEDGPDPVLAHWQYELGKAVAFSSGYWPHWGTDWVGWEQFGKLWAQIVRWSMRQNRASDFQVFTRLEGDKGRVVIEALNKDASYLNFLRLAYGRVIGPDNSTQPLQLTQTGPGRYEAMFEAREKGQYLVSMQVAEPGDKEPALISTGLSIPFSPEYRELSTNQPLLSQIVGVSEDWRELTMDPETDDVFRRPLVPTVASQPVWSWVVTWLLLPLFLLDVAGRRLASTAAFSVLVELLIIVVLLFGVGVIDTGWLGILGVLLLAEVVGWTIRFRSIEPTLQWLTHTVTALGRTGERSTASLSQLRQARDKVRETVTGSGDVEAPGPASRTAPPPAPDRTGRYDVGDEAATEAPARDLGEALGGAAAGAGPAKPKPKPAAAQEAEDAGEDFTSRLLKAKQRAREDIEERKKDEKEDS